MSDTAQATINLTKHAGFLLIKETPPNIMILVTAHKLELIGEMVSPSSVHV